MHAPSARIVGVLPLPEGDVLPVGAAPDREVDVPQLLRHSQPSRHDPALLYVEDRAALPATDVELDDPVAVARGPDDREPRRKFAWGTRCSVEGSPSLVGVDEHVLGVCPKAEKPFGSKHALYLPRPVVDA